MPKINIHSRKDVQISSKSPIWNIIVVGLVFCIIIMLSQATHTMGQPFNVGQEQPISLDKINLPGYALRSVTRMFYALLLSILATFTFGTLAAKSKYAARIIIPIIDILQSIPILGFLSIGIPIFFRIFPGSYWGPECAAILTIFTSQAWNMILSFYQSIKTVPKDMREVAKIFNLSKWQIFWQIEVPYAMPSLLWNTMLSLSAGWFFVVGSEAFSYNGSEIMLPGIGSYIAKAVDLANNQAIYQSLITMLLVIIIYDQILFRPMIAWAQKFNLSGDYSASQSSWLLNIIQKTEINSLIKKLSLNKVRIKKSKYRFKSITLSEHKKKIIWNIFLGLSSISLLTAIYYFIYLKINLSIITHITYLGFLTMLRVFLMIFICCLVWVPIGVYIGLRPKLALKTQPFIQFLAAFPTNLLFPIVVGVLIKYKLSINIWSAPLLVLGTQWYILFNVIAGTMSLPESLHDIARLLKLRDMLWWRALIIPGIFPHLLTGIISAAGGAWNASILAEAVSWGADTLYANGIGAYITYSQKHGHITEMALAIVIMCAYVLLINRCLWQPLYKVSQKRFSN